MGERFPLFRRFRTERTARHHFSGKFQYRTPHFRGASPTPFSQRWYARFLPSFSGNFQPSLFGGGAPRPPAPPRAPPKVTSKVTPACSPKGRPISRPFGTKLGGNLGQCLGDFGGKSNKRGPPPGGFWRQKQQSAPSPPFVLPPSREPASGRVG